MKKDLLSPADKDLWRALTEGVQPLKKNGLKPQAPKKAESRRVIAHATMPRVQDPPPRKKGTGGIDHRTNDKLKQGKRLIEARLDLHGLRENEAFAALEIFIDASDARGRRALLIITGKGEVLRAALPRWLETKGLRDKILATHPARPKDGGDGAFYVLLRRRRGF